jgi:hypothetical protein
MTNNDKLIPPPDRTKPVTISGGKRSTRTNRKRSVIIIFKRVNTKPARKNFRLDELIRLGMVGLSSFSQLEEVLRFKVDGSITLRTRRCK